METVIRSGLVSVPMFRVPERVNLRPAKAGGQSKGRRMRESIETLKKKSVVRTWAQYTPDEQRFKLAQYVKGHSHGDDVPQDVKQNYHRNRLLKKVAIIFCMIAAVAMLA